MEGKHLRQQGRPAAPGVKDGKAVVGFVVQGFIRERNVHSE